MQCTSHFLSLLFSLFSSRTMTITYTINLKIKQGKKVLISPQISNLRKKKKINKGFYMSQESVSLETSFTDVP